MLELLFWGFFLILYQYMKHIINLYIAPNPSILISFFKDFILYPLTLIKKFHWL